jgi:uncharacterized membrane protein (GlpM family)
MVLVLIKVLVSAVVVLGVNIAAQRNPLIGGWIAALPIISFLSALWLVMDGKQEGDIARFLTGVLFGLIPTGVLLGTLIVALRRGWPLPWAALGGLLIWVVISWVVRKTGLLGA